MRRLHIVQNATCEATPRSNVQTSPESRFAPQRNEIGEAKVTAAPEVDVRKASMPLRATAAARRAVCDAECSQPPPPLPSHSHCRRSRCSARRPSEKLGGVVDESEKAAAPRALKMSPNGGGGEAARPEYVLAHAKWAEPATADVCEPLPIGMGGQEGGNNMRSEQQQMYKS